jgi:hypothetical protein
MQKQSLFSGLTTAQAVDPLPLYKDFPGQGLTSNFSYFDRVQIFLPLTVSTAFFFRQIYPTNVFF